MRTIPFSLVIPAPHQVRDRLRRESSKNRWIWIPALHFATAGMTFLIVAF